MADFINLKCKLRNEFGKGAARRMRRDGLVPAVLYGHGTDTMHISMPGHDTQLALRQANVLLTIELEDAEDQLALPKQVQRHPILGDLEHVDLIIVKRGEKVIVEVPVTLVGEADPEAVIMLEMPTLEVEAEALSIPNEIEISIEGMVIGDQIQISEVTLPEGVTAQGEPEDLVVLASAPAAEEPEETDEELEGEEGEEGEEAEGDEDSEGDDEE